MDLAIKAAESREELKLANELIAREYANQSDTSRYWLETCGPHFPGHEPQHTRIAVSKGEVAGALRINTETMRIGEARLRMGGLGWLTIAPRHRNKGIASLLMQDAFGFLKAHRYHTAMLFGSPGIFQRHGLVNAMADYAVLVDTFEAAKFETPFRLRAAKPGDIPAIQRFHAANDSGIDCSIVRTRAHLTHKWPRCTGAHVLIDAQGKVTAYFFAHDAGDHLDVSEVGVSVSGVCAGVLGACAGLAMEHCQPRIRFHVPPPHPFARFLLQFPSVHETHVLAPYSGMMTLVDIGEAFESLVPEWESRLTASAAHDLRAEVTLVTDTTAYRLRANRGAVDVSTSPGRNKLGLNRANLTQLITGYRHVDDVISTCRALVAPDARLLLNCLFPKRYPYVWRFDRF